MEKRLLGGASPAEPKEDGSLLGRVWAESKKIWRVTFPAMLARVTNFGILVVTQAFIGHIGSMELAAYALIQIIGVRFVNGILVRLVSHSITLYRVSVDDIISQVSMKSNSLIIRALYFN